MKDKTIAVFDVGKTNKKVILFDYDLNILTEAEEKFPEIIDDDGFECDDIEKIEKWVKDTLNDLARSNKYDLTAVNFATYGATLVYLDKNGKRLTPVYNYLKPIEDKIPERIYRKHGGQDEFCRQTASPALGMLNSGMQTLWLRHDKPQIFYRIKQILHFPQYLSYLLTGKVYSEHTSIGCHTAMWNFDDMEYHIWTREEGLKLPPPSEVGTLNEIEIAGKKIYTGIGIHDSSASLAPYFSGSSGKFLLLSTGTWCINMNPFNSEKLTAEQLDHDCLCYMSIAKQPVKSSRLFMGHYHDMALSLLNRHFNTAEDYYKSIRPDDELMELCRRKSMNERFFFTDQPYSRELKEKNDFFVFTSFSEGYHQLMVELSELAAEAIDLIIPADDDIENIYITGGFSQNPLFTRLISSAFPTKNVYTSEISNAAAIGAALVVLGSMDPGRKLYPDLGLNKC
ncbi:MAG: FGGY family carbohydrate kinase [Bacteroidales bacterium]|jgi:sugar (pentulose or hexulose) kinase